ncbi:hypothetical protein EDC01DRAFT_634588 [Geopyxis carbonaria]|nr:hypothetical protein EDC01DRAFT_634588 [Geopyxis carbonaria]
MFPELDINTNTMISLARLVEKLNPLPSLREKMQRAKTEKRARKERKLQREQRDEEIVAAVNTPQDALPASSPTTIDPPSSVATLPLTATTASGAYVVLPTASVASTTAGLLSAAAAIAEQNLQLQQEIQERAEELQRQASHLSILQATWGAEERRRDAELRRREAALEDEEERREEKIRLWNVEIGERERRVIAREVRVGMIEVARLRKKLTEDEEARGGEYVY